MTDQRLVEAIAHALADRARSSEYPHRDLAIALAQRLKSKVIWRDDVKQLTEDRWCALRILDSLTDLSEPDEVQALWDAAHEAYRAGSGEQPADG